MNNHRAIFLLAALSGLTAACSHGRYSASAFQLPPDGDAVRGRAAFVSLGCSGCHRVAGVDLPAPTVEPPIPVELGGEVVHRFSDGYLATSMIRPSYDLAPYPKADIALGGHSRMPSYAEKLTIRQMTDIVAFLQAHYRVPREDVAELTR